MELYADKFVYPNKAEEKAIRSYLERPLTLEQEWQRFYNTERKLLYQKIHPEFCRRKIKPYPKPKPPSELDKPKGDVPLEIKFLYPRVQLPERFYLLEFGSTARGTATAHSDLDLLYIGPAEWCPIKPIREMLSRYPLQHHGALTATFDMLNYWPLDLIPPFLLNGAFAHCEHSKLKLWGTWYHREAMEEFIRSVMYWRTWDSRTPPKDKYETQLWYSMATMFPCIYQSARKDPKPKSVANVLHNSPVAPYAYQARETGLYVIDSGQWSKLSRQMAQFANQLMEECLGCEFLF